MLFVWSSWQGAHGDGQDFSPELVLATDARGRGRGRRYRSCQGKQKARLAAQGRGGDACMKEKGRGGRIQPVGVVGEEDKRGGVGSLS